MTDRIPPSLERFGHDLDQAAHRELRTSSTRLSALARRPRRLLAGGTLGVAGLSAGLVLALSGTAATAPAFAVTRQSDGSVLVTVNTDEIGQPWAAGADKQLAAMGINEAIDGIEVASGPATSSAPVSCTPGGALVVAGNGSYKPAPVTVDGPPVKVAFGTAGTDTIPTGTTGAGTVHLVSCNYYSTVGIGTGNTGSGS